MLVELTIEANEESFVIVHQHGGNDVNCKSRIRDQEAIKLRNKLEASIMKYALYFYARFCMPAGIRAA